MSHFHLQVQAIHELPASISKRFRSEVQNRFTSRRSRATRRAHRPAVEVMEGRLLLTANISLFKAPSSGNALIAITQGPGGNLFFTQFLSNQIGEINATTHAISEFPLNSPAPGDIAAGADGKLWFTHSLFVTNIISSLDPSTGVVTDFHTPTANSGPNGVVAGPDGNIWFTENLTNKIAEMNLTTHVIMEYPIGQGPADSGPGSITVGPDGNLWFTEDDNPGAAIGVFNVTTHVATLIPTPSSSALPSDIITGPDGNLWFGDEVLGGGTIHELNPTTHVITDFHTPDPFVRGFAPGPDGNIWFLEESKHDVAELNLTTHAITEFPIPQAAGGANPALPEAMAPGPNGTLWFTLSSAARERSDRPYRRSDRGHLAPAVRLPLSADIRRPDVQRGSRPIQRPEREQLQLYRAARPPDRGRLGRVQRDQRLRDAPPAP